MMLPDRTQPSLNSFCVLKLTHLLKLINAYNNVTVFAFGYYLNHIQYFFWTMGFRSDAKRHANI